MVKIATNNKEIAVIACVAKGDTKVFKESRMGIANIISSLEEAMMLSKDGKLATGIWCWTIDRKYPQEAAVCTLITGPAAAAKFGGIVANTSCVSSGRTCS